MLGFYRSALGRCLLIHQLSRWVVIGSAILAFNAGFINSIALLSFVNNSVSHVTGTVALAADAAVRGQWRMLVATGLIVLSFLLGAVVSGLVVGNEALKPGRRYGVALLIEALLLLAAWYCFRQQFFLGELLASAACGLQNAMVATYSGSVIRTTHLTGIVSDMGSALGNAVAGRGWLAAQFRLQSTIFVAFVVGAGLGSLSFDQWQFNALLAAALWILVAAASYSHTIRKGSPKSS